MWYNGNEMITRVQISGYKSLCDVDLALRPLTVIVGPNASGKSNLFDALRLLSAMATQPDLKTAIDAQRGIPIEAFFTEQGIEESLKQPKLQLSIAVDVALSQYAIAVTERRIRDLREGLTSANARHITVTERNLRYSLTVEFLPETAVLRVNDERLIALNKDGSERKSRSAFFERIDDKISLRMEGQSHPTRHDVGLPYTIVSQPLYAPHYPHITALKEELARWSFYYFDPILMRENTPLKEVKTIGPNGQDLAGYFYNLKVKNPRQFEALSRTLRQVIPAVSGMDVRRTNEGFVELLIIEDGVFYSSRVISEGTLRVLGLLAILSSQEDNTTIGFEEPENGVHPRRIELTAKILSERAEGGNQQLLITTHSPLMPKYFKNSDLVMAARQGHQSTFTPFAAEAPMFKQADIDTALDERVIRGDFGG